jgi:hypothetical protein
MLAEIEVSFFTRYVGQPLFADIEAFMRERGFELIELLELKRYRASNTLGIRNTAIPPGERSGRIAYGNAIFLRSEDQIVRAAQKDSGASLLRAIVGLVAYGKADIAARLLDVGGDCLAAQRARLEHGLSELRRGEGGILARLLGRTG